MVEFHSSLRLQLYYPHRTSTYIFNENSPLNLIQQNVVTLDELNSYSMNTIKEHMQLFKAMENEIIKIFHPKNCIQTNDRNLLAGMLLQTNNSYYAAIINQYAYQNQDF